jgi:hypothetical protein
MKLSVDHAPSFNTILQYFATPGNRVFMVVMSIGLQAAMPDQIGLLPDWSAAQLGNHCTLSNARPPRVERLSDGVAGRCSSSPFTAVATRPDR